MYCLYWPLNADLIFSWMYSWMDQAECCLSVWSLCFSFIVLCYQAVMFSHYADAVEFILNRSLAFDFSCQCESEAGRQRGRLLVFAIWTQMEWIGGRMPCNCFKSGRTLGDTLILWLGYKHLNRPLHSLWHTCLPFPYLRFIFPIFLLFIFFALRRNQFSSSNWSTLRLKSQQC